MYSKKALITLVVGFLLAAGPLLLLGDLTTGIIVVLVLSLYSVVSGVLKGGIGIITGFTAFCVIIGIFVTLSGDTNHTDLIGGLIHYGCPLLSCVSTIVYLIYFQAARKPKTLSGPLVAQ